MIKKARDIQLGDRIADRTVRLITQVNNVYSSQNGEIALSSLDGREALYLESDTRVWVDDPAPCRKPESSVTTKTVIDLQEGDVICVQIGQIEVGTFMLNVWGEDQPNALLFPIDKFVRVLKEVPIEP